MIHGTHATAEMRERSSGRSIVLVALCIVYVDRVVRNRVEYSKVHSTSMKNAIQTPLRGGAIGKPT